VSTPRSTFLASYCSQDREEPFASSKCLPSKKSKTSILAGARSRDLYPLADGCRSARFHRGSKTPTRPFRTPLFAGASRPHALPRLLQRMFQRAQPRTARTSQSHGIRDPGTDTPIDRSLPLDRGTKPPRLRRVRGRGSPNLDIPFRDCSQKGLRPNPDRLRLLASRAWPFILSGVDSDQEPYRQRCLRLQGEDSERAVRRPISAKKSDVHQPEGPSIARSFANERGTSPNSARLLGSVAPTPFSLLRIRARDARRGVWQLGF